MTEHEATRTLVKSPPELWAECSDAGSLGRHLAESFGEIRITRLDPETAVAWEGEHVSGTVRIEPSAWGTRVTLTAQTAAEAIERPVELAVEEPVVIEEAVVEEEPVALEESSDPSGLPPALAPKRGFMARVRVFFRPPPPGGDAVAADAEAPVPSGIDPPPEPAADPRPEPAETAAPPAEAEPDASPREPAIDPEAALTAALESLGQAHHRPFSRA